MKILQINSVCGVGSTGKIATDLYDVLKTHGHECKIAYGRGTAKGIPAEDAIKIGTEFDVKIHGLLTRITDRTGFYSKSATKKLIADIEQFNPDVIHLHNIHGYYINIEVLFHYLAEAKKPVVWTLHDCWAFTGHCAYFDFAQCDKWKTGCANCPQKKSYPSSMILSRAAKNQKDKINLFTSVENITLVTPSHWLAGIVRESHLKDIPVKVIPNGIDLTKFKPTSSDFRIKQGLEHHKIILGIASVWDRRKGLDDFFKLHEMLDETYKIVLVGLTPKQVDTLPAGILGITKTSNTEELAALYSTADVFVNPTYEDNFPTTNLESLACGTLVVTYNTGGSPESVLNHFGFVATTGILGEVKEGIEVIISKNVDKLNISKQALSFDKSKIYQQDLFTLYRTIITKQSK